MKSLITASAALIGLVGAVIPSASNAALFMMPRYNMPDDEPPKSSHKRRFLGADNFILDVRDLQRSYTPDELADMRKKIRDSLGLYHITDPAEIVAVEMVLHSYIAAGLGPDDLGEKAMTETSNFTPLVTYYMRPDGTLQCIRHQTLTEVVLRVSHGFDYWWTLAYYGHDYDGIEVDVVEAEANMIGWASRDQNEVLQKP